MKKITLNEITLLITCIFFIFSSCQDKSKDTTDPIISFTNLDDNQQIRGDFTLEFNATDDREVHKIDFLIDDVMIETISGNDPYQFEINTGDYEDGQHAIKAIVSDSEGNSAFANVSFNIRNLMLTVQAENYFEENSTGYIIIYDMDGEAVEYHELNNNSTKDFIYPNNYDGWDFNATIFVASHYGNNKFFYAITVQRCKSSNWILPSYNETEGYNQNLTFSNIPAHDLAIVSNGFKSQVFSPLFNYPLFTKWNPANIFIGLISGQTASYKWIENAEAGNINIDLTQTEEMSKNEVATQKNIFDNYIYGNLSVNDETRSYLLSYTEQQEYFYIPGFESYTTIIGFGSDSKEVYVIKKGDLLTTLEDPEFDVNITSADNSGFTLTHTGDFDYYMADWSYYDHSNEPYVVTFYTIGGPEDEPKVFPIPAPIMNTYPSLNLSMLEPYYLSAVDLKDVEDYDQISGSNNIDFYFEEPTKEGIYYFLSPNPDGGRFGLSDKEQNKNRDNSLIQRLKNKKLLPGRNPGE